MRHDELYIADLVDSTRAVREYLDGVSRERWDEDRVLRDAVLYRLLLLYQTQDLEVVITEMRATGTVTTTGRAFTTTSVQIIRIRDGHIVHSRDFADPRILEDAIGRGGGNHGPFGGKSS
jgi:hypothetical protein